MLIMIALLAISACQKELIENESDQFQESIILNNKLNGLTKSCNIDGCPVFMNGSMELGSGGTSAFQGEMVDLWSGAYGTADRPSDFQGITPYAGSFMAHMQRYKGNPNYYEAIVSDVFLKEKNDYCLSFQSRGNNLKMEVYASTQPITNNIFEIIPSYINDLGSANFPNIISTTNTADDWKFSQAPFSNYSGYLLFVPTSETVSNPSRMLLDDVELICEYGYLSGIRSQITTSTLTGYDYRFFAELDEENSNLSYLWNVSYNGTGYSSTDESPVFNLPYPGKGTYEVTICLSIRDTDGCCTEKCETFTIGEEIIPPKKLCNYTLCLDTWFEQCAGSDVLISTPKDGWYCISCDDNPGTYLHNMINDIMEGLGYDPVNTLFIESIGDCSQTFVVECWENPISISYICDFGSQSEAGENQLIPSVYFEKDCDALCD